MKYRRMSDRADCRNMEEQGRGARHRDIVGMTLPSDTRNCQRGNVEQELGGNNKV